MNNHRAAGLAAISIVIAIAAPVRAQLTPHVMITLHCQPDGPVYLIVRGDETERIKLTQVGKTPVWTGEKTRGTLLEPGVTVGSLRMGNARTEGVLSQPGTDGRGRVTAFDFPCNRMKVYDLTITTSGGIPMSYLRLLPREPGEERERYDSKDSSHFFETGEICDLRFSDYSMGLTKKSRPQRDAPYEYLCLQAGRKSPIPTICDLIVNDPAIVKTNPKVFHYPEFIRQLANQRAGTQFSQLPTFASVAISFDEQIKIPEFDTMTLTLVPPERGRVCKD